MTGELTRSRALSNAMNDADLKYFVTFLADFAESDNSWTLNAHAIDRDVGPVG
jgi:hypothetical protein